MVNYYTCSQYLTGPAPCPSVQHPDSTPTHTEGRARRQAHLFCPLCWICIQCLTWPGRWKTNCPCKKKMCLYESLENLNLIILEVLHIIWGFFLYCVRASCASGPGEMHSGIGTWAQYTFTAAGSHARTHTHTPTHLDGNWGDMKKLEAVKQESSRKKKKTSVTLARVKESAIKGADWTVCLRGCRVHFDAYRLLIM